MIKVITQIISYNMNDGDVRPDLAIATTDTICTTVSAALSYIYDETMATPGLVNANAQIFEMTGTPLGWVCYTTQGTGGWLSTPNVTEELNRLVVDNNG